MKNCFELTHKEMCETERVSLYFQAVVSASQIQNSSTHS